MTRNRLLVTALVGMLMVIVPGAKSGTAADLTGAGIEFCNPVVARSQAPLRDAAGGLVIHRGSHDCPAADIAQIAAAAASVAEATPAPGLIYFDLDHVTPNATGAASLEAVIEAIKGRALGGVAVAGYTDTSGPEDYNLQLSERRAQTVAAELIKAGVPARIVSTRGFGQTELAVPSADGVALAANRRVVIDFIP